MQTTCPVFHPTAAEFQDFRAYINKIESIIDPDVGLCKIIPPAGWLRGKQYNLDTMDVTVEHPVKQIVSGRAGVYNVALIEIKAMNLRDFAAFNAKNSVGSGETVAERERKFWKSMGVPAWEHPIYGADQVGTLFNEEEGGSWNINKLDSIVSLLGSDIPGVSSAYLYVGTWRSLFAYHVEDLDLYSINYVHTGAEKSWYSIKYKDKKRFESFAESFFKAEHYQCQQFLRHKTAMFSQTKLREVGIEVITCVQEAGEFVITFPGAYHAGFNHGFNIAESTNFATPRWFEIGRQAKRCVCRPGSVAINVLMLETMHLRSERERTAELGRKKKKKGSEASLTQNNQRRFRCCCGQNETTNAAATTQNEVFECPACGVWGHNACQGRRKSEDCYVCEDIDALDDNSSTDNMDCDDIDGIKPTASRKTPQVFVGDSVQVVSPHSGLIVLGTLTAVEDGLGRLHVKNTRKDCDLWCPLTSCILVERARGRVRSSKSKRTPQALSTAHMSEDTLAVTVTDPSNSQGCLLAGFGTPEASNGASSLAPPAKKAKRGDVTPRSATPVASRPRERSQPCTKSVQLLSDLDDLADDTFASPLAAAACVDTYCTSCSTNDDLHSVAKLPDDLVALHAENLCTMLKRMDDIQLHGWFARVVHPFWATSTVSPTYIPHQQSAGEQQEEIQDEEELAFFRDLGPYLRHGHRSDVVVRHIFLRVFSLAVSQGIKLPPLPTFTRVR